MFKPVFWFLIFSLFLPGFVISQEVKTEIADGAILRGLDKVSGRVKDIPLYSCLLYTSPSPRDKRQSRMPSSA